jgi:hypothetical protein
MGTENGGVRVAGRCFSPRELGVVARVVRRRGGVEPHAVDGSGVPALGLASAHGRLQDPGVSHRRHGYAPKRVLRNHLR